MDKEIADLEFELAELRPAPIRPELAERLATELDTAMATPVRPVRRYTTTSSWTSWKWANWSVAAGLIGLLAVANHFAPPEANDRIENIATMAAVDPAEVLKPVRAGRTLIDSRPEGIIELSDGSPVERVRDYYMDTIEWRDAAGRSQLRWEIPRESVRFVALASY